MRKDCKNPGQEVNPMKGEDNYQTWFANNKLTYDTTLDLLSSAARRSQDHYDSIVTGEREHRAELERVSLQALQNAVETANMVAKQTVRAQENVIETANLRGKDAVRHSQIATDRQWNLEPSEAASENLVLNSQTSIDAISAAIAAAVVSALADNK